MELQNHAGSLVGILHSHVWPDRRSRNAVRDVVEQALDLVMHWNWVAGAPQALRDFLSMDASLSLDLAACELCPTVPPASLAAWRIHDYSLALERAYMDGFVPYGWTGTFPGCGGPRRAELGSEVRGGPVSESR